MIVVAPAFRQIVPQAAVREISVVRRAYEEYSSPEW